MSGHSSATLLTMLLPLPRSPKCLARREMGAKLVRAAKGNPNQQPAQWPSPVLEKGANLQERKLVCQTASTGSIPTKFLSCQRRAPVSAPRERLFTKLTRESDPKRRSLRRVRLLPQGKDQTLRRRLGEGLLCSGPCLRLDSFSTAGHQSSSADLI